jgi:hypothetical protein
MTNTLYAAETPAAPAASAEMPGPNPSMQQYRIRRPGARPLIFSGIELAMAMSFTPELPYWYEINIYRTNDQRFVMAVRLFFQSETEDDTVQAWEFHDLPSLFDALEQYDASKDVKVAFKDLHAASPAELTAMALELRAQIAGAKANFAGLIGELFEEMDRVSSVAG